MSGEDLYHLSKANEKFGPFTRVEALERIRSGVFGPDDLA